MNIDTFKYRELIDIEDALYRYAHYLDDPKYEKQLHKLIEKVQKIREEHNAVMTDRISRHIDHSRIIHYCEFEKVMDELLAKTVGISSRLEKFPQNKYKIFNKEGHWYLSYTRLD